MNMNILEQEDLIKGATDDILLQEAKSPTGRVPQFLVISEIQRRKSMRDRFSAQEQQPEQSVAEQIVAGTASQMPPPPQMPPQAPVMAMPPPQMPPEMMAAQMPPMAPPPQMMAAGGGRMPYRRMADGGIVPPNSLVEDAAKFNPEGLDDMDASQMAMASPTNMGIASVLPMAGGGRTVQRGVRNNNPMNIKYSPSNDWEGQVGADDDGFVIFATPQAGMRAGNIILGNYGSSHGINTLEGIVNRFAPIEDNNDTASYMDFVSRGTGIEVNEEIDLGNAEIREDIARSMAAIETPDYNQPSNNQTNPPSNNQTNPPIVPRFPQLNEDDRSKQRDAMLSAISDSISGAGTFFKDRWQDDRADANDEMYSPSKRGFRMLHRGRERPKGGYPDWAKNYIFDPNDPVEVGMLTGSAALGGAGLAAIAGRKTATNLGKFALRKLKKDFRNEKGQFLPHYESGIALLKEGAQTAGRYLNPLRKEFLRRTLPAGLVASHFYGKATDPSNIKAQSTNSELGELGDIVELVEKNNEEIDRVNSTQKSLEFLEEKGYASGGIIRMRNEGSVPTDFVSIADVGKRLKKYYEDNPNANVLPEHAEQIQAFQKEQDFMGRSIGRELDNILDERFPMKAISDLPLDALPSDEARPLTVEETVEEAINIGREQGDLGLTDYEMSKQIRNLDTSNQTDALKDRIDSLEEMKGKTPDTFDITESVLRSGERADKRAMSQALINLGAGIAAGDISKGFKDAGTAVSDVRQRQEEFQQLAEIRKAEAESKAGSDMMARDIGIISSQINALGDINAQDRAAAELLLTREQRVIDATNSGNTNLIAQATHNLNITKYATEINQFDRKLAADIERETDLNRRAALTYYSAQLRALAPELLAKDSNLSEAEKQTWKTSFIEDNGSGWSVNRALADLMAQIEAQMPFTGGQDPFDAINTSSSPTERRNMITLPE